MRGNTIELEGPYGRQDYLKFADGSFASVYRAVSDRFPVHVMKKPRSSDIYSKRMYQREFEIFVSSLWERPHSNIICLVNAVYETRVTLFEKNTYLAFEYANFGDLQSYINEYSSSLSSQVRYQILLGVAQGLDHLHTKCLVVHRDFKPENVVLDNRNGQLVPKIIDFGMACNLSTPDAVLTNVPAEGSPTYVCPETLTHHSCSAKSDIYAFGALMYGMVALSAPLGWLLGSNDLAKVQQGLHLIKNDYRESFTDCIPTIDQKMIHDTWAPDPNIRPTTKQIVDHLQFALQHLDLSVVPPIDLISAPRFRTVKKWRGPKFGIFDRLPPTSTTDEVSDEERDEDTLGCFGFLDL